MKIKLKVLLISLFFFFSAATNKFNAQLPAGSIAQDFTIIDQFGASHNLYNYLNQGYTVYLSVSATWFTPSWNYHLSGALNNLYINHGPAGLPGVASNTTNDVMVIWVDNFILSTDDDMIGLGAYSTGNWLNPSGNPILYPMVNLDISEIDEFTENYQINYWPTNYRICPNRFITQIGQLNATALYADEQECPSPAYLSNDPALYPSSYIGENKACGSDSISTTVVIQNNGITPLTQCTIQISSSTEVLTYNWTGNLNTYAFDSVNVGYLTPVGADTLNISITSLDENISNNFLSVPIEYSTPSSTHIKMDILFDSFPEQLSWFIEDQQGAIVASKDYSNGPIISPFSSKTEHIYLPSLGCYTITFNDGGGDGITDWFSSFNPLDLIPSLIVSSINNDGTIFSIPVNNILFDLNGNPNYFFEYSITFNVLNSTVVPCGCTNILACNFDPVAGCDDGSCYIVNGDCNDNNPNTYNDTYNSSCMCSGIPVYYGSVSSSSNNICPGLGEQLNILETPLGIPAYNLQWYFKTGDNAAPTGSNTSGWNLIPGATSSSLTVGAFTGTRTYACFVTPDASYGISGNWMSGAQVLTYSSFAAQTIIGNPNITPFNAYNYIVNPIPGHTYNWAVTNGAVASGQGTSNVSIMWGQNGPYQLTLTESDGTCSGSSYLFAVNNNCSISVSAASASTNTFCAGTTLQLQAATSATGITYQWYLNGSLIPNETNQNISVSSGGNYQVSINQNGCTAVSNIVSITELPGAIIPSILVEQANAGCAGGDATLTVSGGNYTNLVWNNGLTASSIIVNTSGDYSITAIDENGCSVSAGPVAVNFSILDPVPVCIVTVDQVTGKNNVVWEPITSDLINSYVILKETNVANEYAQIGTVAYGSSGLFEDVNSNPQVQANRYKLALIDTCGILSSGSSFHKTIHLAINQGIGNNVNLIWSNYEGFDFGSYSIYRGTSPNTLNLLSTIASNLNSYTDVNPPAGETYYMIEVVGVSCDPTRTLVYSHSNILDTSVGVEDYVSTAISIYPNPAKTNIVLQVNTPLIGQDYVIFDAIGKVIYKSKIQSTNESVHLENFNNGNYFIKVNEVVKRFVVQH